MTAHIGNWELLAGMLGIKGYRGAVVAREVRDAPYGQWIKRLRQSLNVRTIDRVDGARDILECLRRNEIVGLLPDQDIDSLRGIFVPYFGRMAYTPMAPARLSLASGAPILTNFVVREPGDRYSWKMGKVMDPADYRNHQDAVHRMTVEWMATFEALIRQYREQWAWMHDRWKTQPVRETPLEVSVA